MPPGVMMTSMRATARAARHVVLVMAFAVAFAPAATCLAAVAAATPELPCHASEQRPAQDDSAHMNCCPGDSPNSQSFTPAQQALDPSAPAQVVVAILPVPAVPQVGAGLGLAHVAAGTPRPPGIATYVLVSSFRI
jgi:hypothetical protein